MRNRSPQAIVMLLLTITAFAQSPAKPPKTEARFTMFSAEVMVDDLQNGNSQHRESHVFLLDTWTGKVWLYSPASLTVTPPEKKAISLPARFDRVYVNGLDDKSVQSPVRTFDTK